MRDDATLLILEYRRNRWRAHEELFLHRHENSSPPAHREIVDCLWSPEPRAVLLAFRGSGKSTRIEEYVTLSACERLFRNCIIVGSSEARAAERLAAVSNELKTNDVMRWLYDDLVGPVWTQTKLQLTTGFCIQAMGRDQDIRGIKHLDWRPDLVVVDDFEDKDNAQTPEGRRRTLRWFLSELLPACDPRRRVRVLATPLDAESVPMVLIRKPRPAWPLLSIPIVYRDQDGDEQPTWPERFSLDWVAQERADYEALGEPDVWEREYMVNATSAASRVFQPEMIRVERIEHTFQSKWAMIDPARTVRRTSAFTGWAVWSWERHRLIVWEAGAQHLMPDQIVDLVFRLNRDHQPVEVGIEEDGLNEWLLQPIRARMVADGGIPYRAVKAPRGKLDFIRGLQPFFAAGEVVLSSEMPELRDQLLAFPTGRIDAPNALAYALQLRPGRLIYENWNANAHIQPIDFPTGNLYLAANATREMVAGIMVAVDDGRIRVLGDWIVEGDPGEAAENLVRSASMSAGGNLTVIVGPRHFDQWHNVGFVAALRNIGVQCRPGGPAEGGRAVLRRALERTRGGAPEFSVAPEAHWTLRALSGGYTRPFRNGRLAEEAEDNRYRVLIEGLENLAGLWQWGVEEERERNFAYDAAGKPYLSILPASRQRNRPEERDYA
jgi:hypothetical protein